MTDPPGWTAPGSGQQGWPGQRPGPPPPGNPPPGHGPPPGYAPPPGQPPPGYGPPPPGQPPPGYGPPPPGQPPPGYGTPPPGQPPPGGAPHGYGRPPEPKPGIIPLRPIGLGEILDGAVTYIRQNPKATLGLSAIIAGTSQIIVVLSGAWLGLRFAQADAMSPQALDSAGEIVGTFGASGGALLVTIVVTILASLLLTGMLTAVVGRAVLGQRATIGQAWRQAAPRVPTLLGIAAIISLTLVLAMIVLVAPGVLIAVFGSLGWGIGLAVLGFIAWFAVLAWVFTTFALATPAAVLERAGAVTALRRSRALLRGSWNWWRALGILLLAWIIAGLINGLLQLPFSGGQFALQASGSLVIGQIVATIGAILAVTVVSPFSSGVPALLYVDMRIRREGLDMELQRAAGVGPPPLRGPAGQSQPPYGPGQPPYGPGQPPYGHGQPGPAPPPTW